MKFPDLLKYLLIFIVILVILGAPFAGFAMVMHSLYKKSPPFVTIGWLAFTIVSAIVAFAMWLS